MKIIETVKAIVSFINYKRLYKSAIKCGVDVDGDVITRNGKTYVIHILHKQAWKIKVSKLMYRGNVYLIPTVSNILCKVYPYLRSQNNDG